MANHDGRPLLDHLADAIDRARDDRAAGHHPSPVDDDSTSDVLGHLTDDDSNVIGTLHNHYDGALHLHIASDVFGDLHLHVHDGLTVRVHGAGAVHADG